MSYRGNPQQKFGGPSPWLQGCPPNLRTCLPLNTGGPGVAMGVQGRPMNSPAMNQNFGNSLVNQLALANSLLTNAFSPKTQNFGNQCGSLLGNPPINFNMPNRIMGGNMMSSNFQGPEAKRMRYSNQQNNRGGSYQQRNRQQGRNSNSNYKRNKFRDDNRSRDSDKKDGEKTKQSDDKPKSSDDKNEEDNENIDESMDADKVEETYDPASPTSDGGHAEIVTDDSVGNKVENSNTTQKRPRSPSPQQTKDNTKGTLQVTIQQGSQGRSVSKDGETGSGSTSHGPMFCHVCNVSCGSQENFHKHMNSKNHKLKMDSLITLHEAKTKQIEARMRGSEHLRSIEDKERGRQKGGGYCNICKSHFTGTLIEHKRTKEHKRKKEHLYPFCRKCRIKHFQNREEYEEHCKSEAHKKACEEWNKQRQDSDNAQSDTDEFDDNDEEIETAGLVDENKSLKDTEPKTDDPETEKSSTDSPVKSNGKEDAKEESMNLTVNKETILADDANSVNCDVEEISNKAIKTEIKEELITKDDIPSYNPENPIGQSHIIPLSGLFCKLCRKFYRDNNSAKIHCQSRVHYDNYMKALTNKKSQKIEPTKEEKEPLSKLPASSVIQTKSEKEDKASTKDNSSSSSGNCKQEFSDERILSDIDEILGNTEYTGLVHNNPGDKGSDSLYSEGDQLDDVEENDVAKSPARVEEITKEVTKTTKKSSPRGRRGKGRGRRS